MDAQLRKCLWWQRLRYTIGVCMKTRRGSNCNAPRVRWAGHWRGEIRKLQTREGSSPQAGRPRRSPRAAGRPIQRRRRANADTEPSDSFSSCLGRKGDETGLQALLFGGRRAGERGSCEALARQELSEHGLAAPALFTLTQPRAFWPASACETGPPVSPG